MKVCLSCRGGFQHDSWRCPNCGHQPSSVGRNLSFAPELSKTSDGFPPGAHEHLFQVEPEHFWFSSRNKIILWALEKYFPNASDFFEIGCGTGFVLQGIRSVFPNVE